MPIGISPSLDASSLIINEHVYDNFDPWALKRDCEELNAHQLADKYGVMLPALILSLMCKTVKDTTETERKLEKARDQIDEICTRQEEDLAIDNELFELKLLLNDF